jgi:hypothetical protein
MTVEVEVAPNVKRSFELSPTEGASPTQQEILNDWLRKGPLGDSDSGSDANQHD